MAVTPGAVSQWLKKAREGGAAALQVRIPPGAPPKLTAEQRAELPRLLAQDPRYRTVYAAGDTFVFERVGE